MGAFTQTIFSNGTITVSGSSSVFTNFGNNETSLVINVTGPVTGSTPTLTVTIQEVDPGNQSTTLGASKTGAAITGVGTQIITIPNLTTGSIIISWVVTGSSPSFGGVYATLVDKPSAPYLFDLSGNGPAAIKAASTAAVATDPALVVAVSPNNSITAVLADVNTGSSPLNNGAFQSAAIALSGAYGAGMQLAAGTLVGTIVAEISYDGGLTWAGSFFDDPTTGNKVSSIVFASSNPAVSRTIVAPPGASHARVRVSVFTSGTANCSLRATVVVDPPVLFSGPAAGTLPPTVAQIGGSVTAIAPTYSTGTFNAASLTTAGALRVDGSTATQPVSGTVTGNQGTANTLANAWSTKITDATNGPVAVKAASTAAVATDPALVVAISPNNSLTVSNPSVGSTAATTPTSATLAGGAVTTSAPTYTTGQMNPLSLDTSGNLRVAGSFTPAGAADTTATGSLGALNAAVQVAMAGQNNAAMQLVAGTLVGTIIAEVSVDGGTTWVTAFFDDPTTGNKVSTIVFGSSNTATTRSFIGTAGASHVRVRVSAFTSGTATCNLRASVMEDPSLLSEGFAAAALPPNMVQIGGSVTTAAPTYGTGTLNALSLNTSGAVRVDGSGVTQPVSGTVTANQGTANTLANAWPTEITDGTHGPAAVKAASTAAVATDAALVVAISPNSNTIVAGAASDTTASGALGALNAAVQVALAGQQSVGLQLSSGTLIGTIIPEQSIDGGTTWNQAFFIDPTTKVTAPFLVFSSSNAAADKSIITTGGASHARVRVSIYTSGTANVNLRASQVNPGFPSMGQAITYPRTTRLDRFGNSRVGFDNLLMTDAIEGSTLNSWLWSTSTLTATVNQGTGQINLNGSATANTYAILTSNRQFQVMDHGPVKVSFYASFAGGDPNPNTMELGFGAPTTTSTLTKGAFFRINGTTGSVDCIFGGSTNVSSTGVFAIVLLGTRQAYHFIIELEDWGARYIIEDASGNNLVDINLFGFNGVAGAQTLQVTHIPVFARVFTGVSALTFTPQIGISGVTVLNMELASNKPWSEQMASTGRSAIIHPTSFAQTPQLATGAAPTPGAPSNTVSLYSTMGGEFICSATATSENLLSIFGFNIPSPYTFYLTGIFIPACIVAGAATATTATVLEFAVVANATSNNISTGGGYRFTLPAQFQVPVTSAIGTVFNGQPCNWRPGTPIACKSNTFLHIAYKVILGTATASNQNRGNVYIDGYFE